MARRKHSVLVEVTFEEKVTEKEAQRAVEKMIDCPFDQWASEIAILHGGVDRIAIKSATRVIASLRAAAKGSRK